jgi:iron(III) transport system permease protein
LSTLLANSLITSGAATALAVVFGFAAALFVSALPARAQWTLLVLAIVAFALPPFAVVNAWLHYVGATGTWRKWLDVNIFTMWGAAWLIALMLWPITFAAVWSAWKKLDLANFEAEPSIAGWVLVRWLLLPAARNAIAAAAVVTFALALNQFSIPAILQVKVLPVEFWIRFSTNLRADQAFAACWPLIVVPFAAWLVLKRTDFSWTTETGPMPARAFRRQFGRVPMMLAGTVTIVAIALSVGLPLAQLLGSKRTWTELPVVIGAALPVIKNTFLFAAVTALLVVVLGMVIWRFRAGGLLWLLFFAPGMLLSLAVIWLLNRPGLEVIYRSTAVIVVALGLRYLGPVWAWVRHSFCATDRALIEAAKLEGLGGWALFRHVYWPRVGPTVFGAWYLVYLLCLWDVESIVLLYPPGAETLALRAFNLLHYGHTGQVNGICLLLITLAVAPALAYALTRWLLHSKADRVALSPTNPTLTR